MQRTVTFDLQKSMSHLFVIFCHTIHNDSFQNSHMGEGKWHELFSLTYYLLTIILAFLALCHMNFLGLVGLFNFVYLCTVREDELYFVYTSML